MTDFRGYNPLIANFAPLPIEVMDDEDLDLSELTTLVLLTGLIAFEQFKRGAGRLTPVPLSWAIIAKRLHLSEDASKARVASLEALGRIRITEGPKQLVKGHFLDGPNLFVLRWTDEPMTSRLASRVARRIRETERKSFKKLGVLPRTPSDDSPEIPRDAPAHPYTPRTPNPDRFTPAPTRTPINRDTEKDVQKELKDNPSVCPSSTEITDRQTDRFPVQIMEILGEILDPPQLPIIEDVSPWDPSQVWQILESIRVFGARLDKPKAVIYNALTIREKGNLWLGKVSALFNAAGWAEVPEDGTYQEDQSRKLGGVSLTAAGLRRLPASKAILEDRAALKIQAPSVPAAVEKSIFLPKCEDAKAEMVWNSVLNELREMIPPSTFSDWITPLVPISFLENGVLNIFTDSISRVQWIDSQLAEEIYLACEATMERMSIPSLRISIQAPNTH